MIRKIINNNSDCLNNFYIFLDIDGVLNNKADWSRPYTFNKYNLNTFDNLLRVLNKQLGRNIHIILTSSWKNSINDKKLFLPLNIILSSYNAIIFEKTDNTEGKSRQEEIEHYLKQHPEISEYLILDDDEKLYYNISNKHIFLTDYKAGLTADNVKKIIKFVKKGVYV